MKLNEIIGPTIQGEGIFTGCPSMFVRVQGCSLRCPQCDTKHSWQFDGEDTPLIDVQERLQEHPDIDVVITGGEPMDAEHIEEVAKLAQWALLQNRRVTIETSGQFKHTKAARNMPNGLGAVELWSVSPKLPAMGFDTLQVNCLFAQALSGWGHDLQLKFVVSPETLKDDLTMIQEYLGIYGVRSTGVHTRVIFQVATKHFDGLARDQILDDWARLVDAVLKIRWLQRLKPQILPQAHRLIGVE